MEEKFPTFQPAKPRYGAKNSDVDVCGVLEMSSNDAEFI